MIGFFKTTRNEVIQNEINSVVHRITDDYSDAEIASIVNTIRSQSLAYLRNRNEELTNEINDNLQSIKDIE